MINSAKYFLTYDFNLIYQATAMLKIFDKNSGEFKTLDTYQDFTGKAYEIQTKSVGSLISKLYKEPIGYELSIDKMNWIQEFESKLVENSKILRNRSLVFNYLILKLLLIGFNESDAKNFVISYFSSQYVDISIAEMISKINEVFDRKEYWVLNDLKYERNVLRNFILTILKDKIKDSKRFSFEKYRDEDKILCTRLIVPKLIKFHQQESYLIRKPKELTNQKIYLMEVYEIFIKDIVETIINEDLHSYHFEDYFLNSILHEMKKDADNYLKIIELNPDFFKK